MTGKPTIRGEEFKCNMIWQMVTAVLHSNGQQRTEGWRHRERMSETCCAADGY